MKKNNIPPIVLLPPDRDMILCPMKEVYVYYETCLKKCDYKKKGRCPKFLPEVKK